MLIKMNRISRSAATILCAICCVWIGESSTTAQSTEPSAPKTAPATKGAQASPSAMVAVPAKAKAKTQVFVLPLDGMVGIGLRHDEMETLEKIADIYGPHQVIILRINSNGGLVIEGDKIGTTLSRIKQKHRLVAWIEKAISGGAFTGLFCNEMYFMPEATLGSITMMSGGTEAKEVREDWKERVAEACAAGGHDPLIGPAMVHSEVELSYERDGDKVTFYNDVKHTHVLSNNVENLDFNAVNALHCNFSDGTAATEADLFREMGVDDPSKFEINSAGKKIHKDWQKLIADCKQQVPLLLRKRDIEGQSQGGIPFLQARIRNTEAIVSWFKKCSPEMTYGGLNINERAIEQLKEEIKQMRNLIKDMQAAAAENPGG